MSLEFGRIKTFVEDAEKTIKGIISDSFYNVLNTYINSPNPVNAYKQEIIELLRSSITYMLFDLGFDILNTTISNQGFHRIENEQSGKKALFQRQEENLRRTFRQQGWNKLDLALAYMEKNKTEFAEWVSSEEYTLTRNRFINSTKEFDEIYNINNNRLVFMRLRRSQVLSEDFDIIPLIGQDYFAELKYQILSDSLTEANNNFLKYLVKAVAYRTIFRGGIELLTELNEYGFYQKQIEKVESNFKSETIARESIFNQLIEQARMNGQSYLKSCESFLKANILDYPTFANSSAYDTTGSVYNLKGTDKIGII